ncbi:transmembrane protein 207 isoform X1 [Dipodomys spectabilis]|uniref:transmembrane protein 207 isoform X1 n=1 Tax=Dipodomys spectabilis TaxID=105255 RepID=UPI001C537C39|nr:transmembrane protein 207 isoform X1 [Dipodomys spectabilis]
MSRTRCFSVTSVISAMGTLCTPLFQLLSRVSLQMFASLVVKEAQGQCPGLEFKPQDWQWCINYNDERPNMWYIWFLLLIFLVALLCGVVLFCFQCWLKGPTIHFRRRTRAVFAIGDLDPIYGTEAAVRPTVGAHLHTQNHDLYPVPCFGTLDSPPPYEEITKTSQL